MLKVLCHVAKTEGFSSLHKKATVNEIPIFWIKLYSLIKGLAVGNAFKLKQLFNFLRNGKEIILKEYQYVTKKNDNNQLKIQVIMQNVITNKYFITHKQFWGIFVKWNTLL